MNVIVDTPIWSFALRRRPGVLNVQQQRLTRVQWEREVDKMVRWGAKVNPPDREGLLDYLFHLYGPRPQR